MAGVCTLHPQRTFGIVKPPSLGTAHTSSSCQPPNHTPFIFSTKLRLLPKSMKIKLKQEGMCKFLLAIGAPDASAR